MLEIEQKFPVADYQHIVLKIAQWQTEPAFFSIEEDDYFAAPDRDFARTDEALRLRRVGSRNVATYKGPKEAGPTKTRLEIEVPLADGPAPAEQFRLLLTALGYRPVATVRKRRQVHHLQREGFSLQICLDDVDHVGRYAEVEIVTEPERKEQAQRVLADVVAALGLANPERRSYLEMLLGAANR